MNKKGGLFSIVFITLIFLFLLLFMDSVEAFGEANISNCSMNLSAGLTAIHTSGTYWLNQSMNSSGRCLLINGSNIELDCRGWSINGTKIQDGIFSNASNVTIKNCIIHNFSIGINLSSALNINMINNSIYNNNMTGIFLASTNNSLLENNTVYFNNGTGYENYGIHLQSSKNNRLIRNNASLNGDADAQGNYGIFLLASSDNNLTYNIANNNTQVGIFLWANADNNSLINNTANNNSDSGIIISACFNNFLANNSANNNSDHGIELLDSENNNLTSNKAKSNNNFGIRLDGSDNNTLNRNIYISNNTRGISLLGSHNNTLTNNAANNNSFYGIYLFGSLNNTLSANTIKNNSVAGIYITANSHNTTISHNTANKNVQHGFYINGSNENIITNNTCNDNINGIDIQGNSTLNIFSNNTMLYNFNGYDIGGNSVNNTFSSDNLSNPRGWDIHMDDGTDNKFYNIAIFSNGTTNPHKTKFSFKKYNSTDMHLKGIETPQTNPAGLVNISKYVFIMKNQGDWVVLNVSYSDADIVNLNESSLKIYRRNSTWEELNSTVNLTLNFVSVNLSNYSNFGVFGEEPAQPQPPAVQRRSGGGSSATYAYSKPICECVLDNGNLYPKDCEKPLLKSLPSCTPYSNPDVFDEFAEVFSEENIAKEIKPKKGIPSAGKAILPDLDELNKPLSISVFGVVLFLVAAVFIINIAGRTKPFKGKKPKPKQPKRQIKYEDIWNASEKRKHKSVWNPSQKKKIVWNPFQNYKNWNPFKAIKQNKKFWHSYKNKKNNLWNPFKRFKKK